MGKQIYGSLVCDVCNSASSSSMLNHRDGCTTAIWKEFRFASSSRVGVSYTVLLMIDRTMSCDCPTWTKGWKRMGLKTRACKHTNAVIIKLQEAGLQEVLPAPPPLRDQKITVDVVRFYKFKSGSRPGVVYTTNVYADGSTSCNCPAWTKWVDLKTAERVRSCRHIKVLEDWAAGRNSAPTGMIEATKVGPKSVRVKFYPPPQQPPPNPLERVKRKFDLD